MLPGNSTSAFEFFNIQKTITRLNHYGRTGRPQPPQPEVKGGVHYAFNTSHQGLVMNPSAVGAKGRLPPAAPVRCVFRGQERRGWGGRGVESSVRRPLPRAGYRAHRAAWRTHYAYGFFSLSLSAKA